MEAAASVAVAARGVSMTMPSSQSSRKEWRVVSDHLVQNSGKESVNGSDDELHLEDVVKQREQLQHLEVNMKARLIARSEVLGMQEQFDSQINEHITSNVKLQEQLHDMENTMMELQRTLDDKDKELHAIRLDHEAAWAKEDLLREQNKELATFRRELDNSEAERAQNLQNIHDLQEHIQEKERQFIELQEQHRVAQETLRYKDEQLSEAQAWISRVQEMDAMQSTTNHSLNAELRERIEQYNHLWVGLQRQYAEMERLHLQTLQQLDSELSEARERNGTKSEGSHTVQTQVKDVSHFAHGNGSQLEAVGDSRVLQNGDAEIVSSQTDNIPAAAQMTAQSLHGMPNYFPPGHLAAMHPYFLHYQGLPQSVNSHLVQSHAGQFHSLPANSPIPHWQNQQVFSESSQMPNHEPYSSQNDQHSLRPESNYNYESQPINGQALRSDFLDISQGLESQSVISSSPNEEDQGLQQISSQLHGSLNLNHSVNDIKHQEQSANMLINHVVEHHSLSTEQLSSSTVSSDVTHSAIVIDASLNNMESAQQNNYLVGKTAVKALFDEGTLLACVVRTIPPGPRGRIQISSTLLSRLTKMLAPLNWSDYENKHGKLDAFLGSHPELFVIEGDYIQVREGAQEIIARMVARAKLHAATVDASATSSQSSLLSSVAVTPMAQTRLKKAPSINSSYANAEKNRFIESQHQNGVSFNPVGVKVVSKPSDQINVASVNGLNVDRSNMGSQGKVINHGRPGSNYHGKPHGRSTGGLLGSRK
ncbi:uncharacterized protein [Rutidosis leptorrhynchoides]|uniref:uncharacterized protein isoform X2 n=1 Tax=Rutidosis leptorrhynchoides TaxID=125765 RepID=UPI003A9A5D29